MIDKNYRAITLDWDPSGRSGEHRFWLTAIVVFVVVMLVAARISTIRVPEPERKQRAKVPDRVAEFIEERPKPKPTPPPPPPPPPPKPKPKVARQVETAEDKQPLTVEEKQAREKASETGLLALTSELSDLIDTSDVDDLVAGAVTEGKGGSEKVSIGTESLLAGTGEGSGGVDTGDYVAGVGGTKLSKRQVALVKQSLFKEDAEGKITAAGASGDSKRERTGNVRSEEEISLVFDQNKGSLYSIYNRERRKNPGLKGKIVLELTISPEGNVTKVRVVSSELDSPSLEKRLLARIKLFKFESKAVEPVTVVFPIEFLPS